MAGLICATKWPKWVLCRIEAAIDSETTSSDYAARMHPHALIYSPGKNGPPATGWETEARYSTVFDAHLDV